MPRPIELKLFSHLVYFGFLFSISDILREKFTQVVKWTVVIVFYEVEEVGKMLYDCCSDTPVVRIVEEVYAFTLG